MKSLLLKMVIYIIILIISIFIVSYIILLNEDLYKKELTKKEFKKEISIPITYMIASWYGEPFHGRIAADGSTYNMYEFTAAHKTLKFGTKLLVINPENGQQVEVIITDRGPFIKGRDLDLSFAAMDSLDLIEKGVAKVEVKFINKL